MLILITISIALFLVFFLLYIRDIQRSQDLDNFTEILKYTIHYMQNGYTFLSALISTVSERDDRVSKRLRRMIEETEAGKSLSQALIDFSRKECFKIQQYTEIILLGLEHKAKLADILENMVDYQKSIQPLITQCHNLKKGISHQIIFVSVIILPLFTAFLTFLFKQITNTAITDIYRDIQVLVALVSGLSIIGAMIIENNVKYLLLSPFTILLSTYLVRYGFEFCNMYLSL